MYRPKKDKRSVQSCSWIYEALRALMEEKPYSQITVTELVERARVGRATFYRNFDCVDDVLHMRCAEVFGKFGELLLQNHAKMASELQSREKTTGEYMYSMYHRLFLRFWYVDSEIITLLLRAHRFDLLYASFEEMYTELAEKTGRRQEIDERIWPYVIAAASSVSIGVLVRWIEEDKSIPPDDLARFLDELIERAFEEIRSWRK